MGIRYVCVWGGVAALHTPPLSHALLLAMARAYGSTSNNGSTLQASTMSYLLILLQWSKPATQVSPMANHSAPDEAEGSHMTKPNLHGEEKYHPPMG